jgi:hypothetical protein
LYENGVAALSEKVSTWEAIRSHIENIQTDRYGTSGQDISRLVQTEHQLSADPKNAEPTMMKDLLGELADALWPPSELVGDCSRVYEEVVPKRQLYGQPILSHPNTIYRYMLLHSNSLFIKKIITSLEKNGQTDRADEIRRQMFEIANRSAAASWELLLGNIKDMNIWTKINHVEVPLSGSSSTFVTFDLKNITARRRSARWLVEALALPWVPSLPETSMIEFRFPRKTNDRLLFPTLCDAGWWRGVL